MSSDQRKHYLHRLSVFQFIYRGKSGYFARDLEAYGREGRPCRRCGTAIVRSTFMNRSSYHCPRCQRLPRRTP